MPRIYVYKITFLEVPHYYYGAHLEKVFDEYYMGSPKTHKNFWELYIPQKEIIKEFPYTDEGWLEALEYEDSLIKPVYNIDPLCLNEHCGGRISLNVLREIGRRCYELGVGIHSQTKEKRIENGKKGTQKQKELGVGIYALTKEELSENGKKGYEASLANLSKEELSENGKKGTQKQKELGVGLYALTKEERSEISKKANSQVWECTEVMQGDFRHIKRKEVLIQKTE